jgi:SAM-dependent methyltransferase
VNPAEYEALRTVEDRHWWFVALRREISRALDRHASRPGRWLDAGSGTGGLLAGLEGERGLSGFGVEWSAAGIALAAGRGLRRLVLGSVSDLPFASGSFGLLTSIDVLCHRGVAKEAALAEAYRCLAPGGILVLQVPAFDWLRGEHDAAVWTDRRFRRPEIRAMVERAGFAVVECLYRVSLLFPAAAARRVLAGRRAGAEARSEVRPASAWMNRVLGSVMSAESSVAAAGLRLPFGLSVFCVARKTER